MRFALSRAWSSLVRAFVLPWERGSECNGYNICHDELTGLLWFTFDCLVSSIGWHSAATLKDSNARRLGRVARLP
jgi:hypothetical protein